MAVTASIVGFSYRNLLKPLLFLQDPEVVHDAFTGVGEYLGEHAWTRALTRKGFSYSDPRLAQVIGGVDFPNPIGLAAGFDKNGHLTEILPELGFGFMEIGSITALPFAGNPRPRLWRMPQAKSLVVWYGLKSDGAQAVANRLAGQDFGIPLGTSIAMSNCKQNAEDEAVAITDYVEGFRTFARIGDYFAINVSCPNTFGGQPFTTPEKLDRLLTALDRVATAKPVFVKLSPDLPGGTIDALVDVVLSHRVQGLICSNLTKRRDAPGVNADTAPAKGGFSGKAVEPLANRLIERSYARSKGKLVIVGCGGVFNAEDAFRKIALGASLVQMVTGLVYQGPQVVGEINRGLARILEERGFKNVADAVGSAH